MRKLRSTLLVRAKPGSPSRGLLIAGPLASRSRSAAAASRPTSARATAARRAAPSGCAGCGGGPTARRGRHAAAGAAHRRRRRLVRAPGPLHYNQPIRLPPDQPGDRLKRDDHLYDLIVELDHNTRPRVAGRGSAVFIHVARPGFAPTAGCVALRADALRRLLAGESGRDSDRGRLTH